jgi:hypothetical protein
MHNTRRNEQTQAILVHLPWPGRTVRFALHHVVVEVAAIEASQLTQVLHLLVGIDGSISVARSENESTERNRQKIDE